jgi:hypothetical protein
MTEPYPNKPVWVQRIDSEIAGYEKERQKHTDMVVQYDKKIDELQDKRSAWTNRDGAADA